MNVESLNCPDFPIDPAVKKFLRKSYSIMRIARLEKILERIKSRRVDINGLGPDSIYKRCLCKKCRKIINSLEEKIYYESWVDPKRSTTQYKYICSDCYDRGIKNRLFPNPEKIRRYDYYRHVAEKYNISLGEF